MSFEQVQIDESHPFNHAHLSSQSDSFQADIYPPALSAHPAMSAVEFFSGKTAEPILVSLENQAETAAPPLKSSAYANAAPSSAAPPTSSDRPRSRSPSPAPPPKRKESVPSMEVDVAPVPPSQVESSPSTQTRGLPASVEKDQVEKLQRENESLREELQEKDYVIRNLELQYVYLLRLSVPIILRTFSRLI